MSRACGKMGPMRTFAKAAVAACMAVVLSGCAGTYLNTYRAAAITRDTVTEAHKALWSGPLNERADECERDLGEDYSLEEIDACMKPYTLDNNDKVVKALAAYRAAASTLSAILIAAEKNPEGLDKEALRDALGQTLDAAKDLIALFPEAQQWLDRLEMLLKGLVQ